MVFAEQIVKFRQVSRSTERTSRSSTISPKGADIGRVCMTILPSDRP